MQGAASRSPPLFLMGRLYSISDDATDLVSDRHVLRFLRQETGNQPGLSAGRVKHGHVPHGDVPGS